MPYIPQKLLKMLETFKMITNASTKTIPSNQVWNNNQIQTITTQPHRLDSQTFLFKARTLKTNQGTKKTLKTSN